jgi:putative endonuclease
MDGHARAARGRVGEAAAEAHLVGLGLRLVERDVRLRNGQLDLVMLDGDCLVLVEVKARRGDAYGSPQEAVHRRKLQKLRELALTYRQLHPELGRRLRIDVVAVRLDPAGAAAGCQHLVDVLC